MLVHHINLQNISDYVGNIFLLKDKGFYSLIIAFLPTIIAISYPLIIQTITKLNDTYSSTLIINLFKKEKIHIAFKTCLIVSLIFSGLTFLNYETINITAFTFIVVLVVLFIKYIELILKYNNPPELYEHILHKTKLKGISLNSIKPEEIQKKYKYTVLNYHEIICDLYCHSIKLEDYTLEANIREKYFYLIAHVGKLLDSINASETSFDPIIYNSNYRIIESYSKLASVRTRYQHIEFFAAGYYLPTIIEEKGPVPFNSQTFLAVWNNILLLVKTSNYNKLKSIWVSFHNYYFFYLKRSYLEYDKNYKVTKESIENSELINNFVNNFKEFNIAFLALLYYKEQYKLIDQLIFYTQNLPAKTFLQEFNPQILFEFYLKSKNEILLEKWNIYYYFDDLEFDSIGFQRDSIYYITEMSAILFIYSWIDSHGIMLKNRIQGMIPPEDLPSKRHQKEEVPYLVKRIQKILSQRKLIENTSLGLITRKKCLLNNIKHPIDFLQDYKNQLDISFAHRLSSGTLDESKLEEVKSYTIKQISHAFNDISRIKGEKLTKEERDVVSQHMETIRGIITPLSREAFLPDPTIHFVDYDKIIGREIKINYYAHFIDKLSLLTKINLKVEFTKLFKAVDKLSLRDHFIISINLNLEYLNNYLNLGLSKNDSGMENYRYGKIPIYSFTGGSQNTGRLFILRNSDKPMILHKDWKDIENPTPEFISRWEKMKEIDEDLHIYYEMTELSRNTRSAQYIQQRSEISTEELSKMILFDFDFLGYCWFPKNAKIVSIAQGDQFQQGGNLDDIDGIDPF